MACKDCEKLKLMLDQALHERDEAIRRAEELRLQAQAEQGPSIEERKSKLLYLLTGERR